MYPKITFFDRTIGTYGLCALIGFLVSAIVAIRLSKRYRYDSNDMILLTLTVCGGMFLGGHLLYGMTQWGRFATALSGMGKIPFRETVREIGRSFGGMVFYGGFLGGLAAVFGFTRFSKAIPRSDAIDLYVTVTPLFHTFGRIGCFLGGCCYGKEWHWGFLIQENEFNPSVAGILRIPVQLIEAGCNLLIFFVLLILFLRGRNRGKQIYVYLLSYPIVRFVLEFYRGDEIRGSILGFSTSQWISLILVGIAAVGIIKRQSNQMIKS